ncbi:hypothetical protein AX17_003962 [Amanita inopinata Kibby_2008]|nr:hypothetical protein AX17_003962 [Amanita inopinata Kibby_2008]
MNNLSSSSSSSSVYGSEPGTGSRATTPSSDISNSCRSEAIQSPKCYVLLTSAITEPDALKTVFEKHALNGTMGLFLPTSPHASALPSIPSDSRWMTECLEMKGMSISYKLTPSAQEVSDLNHLETINSIDPIQASHLKTFAMVSLRSVVSFAIEEGKYALYILEKPTFTFAPISVSQSFTAAFNQTPVEKKGNIPTLEEWQNLWTAWDLVTLQMIPRDMLHQKPIDLRHKCLFYIGHIPTFLDMLLSKAVGGGPSEPKHFWNIFERGIDPHVDDPEHCHRHSEVPERDDDWPTLENIINFRERVHARLARLYEELQTGKRHLTRNIARTLVMTFEHEGFHVETLLYMLLQRAGCGTLPPPGFVTPPWMALHQQWSAIPNPSTSGVVLGPETVLLGHDDCEGDDDDLDDKKFNVNGHTFGWDNESPARCVNVGRFRAEWRPVTNGEFELFWRKNQHVSIPKSWCIENGEVKVRTFYGPVPLDIAQHWPVLTSYDDLSLYAQSKGGRLPTEPELRLFFDKYDVGYEGGANVGFRHWHPTPATTGLDDYQGRGSNGGVWEWTSTVFDTHEGLSPTKLFVGYSTDFFDMKHQVVLGASYATIPRLAGRRTVRNFYQHNYPYAWVGARVVYDL